MASFFAVLSSDLMSGATSLDFLQSLIETNHESLDSRFPVNANRNFVNPNLALGVDRAFLMMGSNRGLQADLGPFRNITISFNAPNVGTYIYISKLKKKGFAETPRTYVQVVSTVYSTTYKYVVIPGGVVEHGNSPVTFSEIINALEKHRS